MTDQIQTQDSGSKILQQQPPGNGGGDGAGGGTGGGTGDGGGKPWYDGIKNPDVKTWLDGKKYADLETLASSAFSSERLIGADKAGRTVMLPKDDNDVETRTALWAKLGVPAKPEDYKLPFPTGDDGVFAKTAASWFHKNGVPAKAAEGIANEWNTWMEGQLKASKEAEDGRAKQQLIALQGEWGDAYKANEEISRRGFRAIAKEAGLEDADLKAVESTLGTAKLLKMFHQIGRMTQEGGFAGGGGGSDFGMSAAQAQEKLNQITADRSAGKITDYEWNSDDMKAKVDGLVNVIANQKQAA